MNLLRFFDIPVRSRDRELIDDHEPQGEDLRRMLDELGVINHRLGGIGSSLAAVDAILREESTARPGNREDADSPRAGVSILDVGCGGGEFPRAFQRRHGRRNGFGVMAGCDRSIATCRMAAARGATATAGAPFIAADGFFLPLRARSCEIAHCSLFLHHFQEDEIGRLLREMLRVARLGVLVNDLHRSRLAEAGIRLLTGAFSRSPFIRNDAPLSVRRGFLADEIVRIWEEQGLPRPVIRWRWAFRYLIWTPKPEGP
jgi:ubiquinone/menaquinone biosynthesis C-methylase UbiE